MKKKVIFNIAVPLLFLCGMTNCRRTVSNDDYLLSFCDTLKNEYGYKNQLGEIVIPSGKYVRCFTDTFRTYAIVTLSKSGFAAIDRQGMILYKVFAYDNGPDYPSEGLFRIIADDKIGYADAATGKVVISPRFACARPFENGVAEVSMECKTKPGGEHSSWQSDKWFYIDRSGEKITKPGSLKE